MNTMRCPKCEWEQPEADACRRCGLAKQRMDAFVRPSGGSALAAAWAEVEADWSQSVRHDALIAAGLAQGDLPSVARLYLQASRSGASEAERADAQVRAEAIGKMAQAALLATAAPRREEGNPKYKRLAMLLLAGLMLLLLGVAATFMLGERQREDTRQVPTIRSW